MRPTCFTVGLLCLFALTSVGCQHAVLQRRTGQQASRLPDLYCQEVLNNIAMFSENPDSVPHFTYASSGTTQVLRTGGLSATASSTGNLAAFFFSGLSFTPNASQSITEAWNTVPSSEPDELFLMRCVFQRTVGRCNGECDEKVRAFFGAEHVGLPAMQPGWYCVGSRHDVPRDAAYVGHHGNTYAWVTADQVDNLSRLVLAMVDVATADVTELTKRGSRESDDARLRRQLEERINYLSGVLKNYPVPLSPGALELQRELDVAVLQYLILTKKKALPMTEKEWDELFDTLKKRSNLTDDDRRTKDLRAVIEQAKRTPLELAPAPVPQGPIPPRLRKQPLLLNQGGQLVQPTIPTR